VLNWLYCLGIRQPGGAVRCCPAGITDACLLSCHDASALICMEKKEIWFLSL